MKYMKFKQGIIFALLMWMGLFNAHAHEDNELTVYVDNSYPPYMYKTRGTEADGLYPRLIEEIAKHTSHKLDIKAYPWKRVLAYGISGKGAVGGAYKNDERIKVYDYSIPLYQEKMVVFVNKENAFEFTDIQDLKGKVIGVNRGWSYGQKFDAARDKELFAVNIRNNPSENFKLLALGRIDCLILDQQSGESYLALLNIEDKVTSLPNAFSENNGYLIISKELNKGEFLKEFNTALEQIRADGTYKNIVQSFVQGRISQ